MNQFLLPETELMKFEQIKKEGNTGAFVIEPLYPGYGTTIGNALRRVLISSLEGAAVTSVRIESATHEFSTIPGVTEDVVELTMNLKRMHVKLHGDEPTTLLLDVKGPKEVSAADFKPNSLVEILNPELKIATLSSKAKLSMEVTIEKGRGYETVDKRKSEKMPLGTIALDGIFTPTLKVDYTVENTRVGGMTNFDKLTMEITTNGSMTPEESLKQAAKILVEHFGLLSGDIELRPEVVEDYELPINAGDSEEVEEIGLEEVETKAKKTKAKAKEEVQPVKKTRAKKEKAE